MQGFCIFRIKSLRQGRKIGRTSQFFWMCIAKIIEDLGRVRRAWRSEQTGNVLNQIKTGHR
jgi:hypothetical protein